MATTLGLPSQHVPPDSYSANENLIKFMLIIDDMQKLRRAEIENYKRALFYPLATDIKTIRRFVDEFGADYTTDSSLLCLDCLYKNFSYIFLQKGTEKG